jgi:hypothetical protein
MTLGQILYELHATQKRTEGRKEGRTHKGKSKCPSYSGGTIKICINFNSSPNGILRQINDKNIKMILCTQIMLK